MHFRLCINLIKLIPLLLKAGFTWCMYFLRGLTVLQFHRGKQCLHAAQVASRIMMWVWKQSAFFLNHINNKQVVFTQIPDLRWNMQQPPSAAVGSFFNTVPQTFATDLWKWVQCPCWMGFWQTVSICRKILCSFVNVLPVWKIVKRFLSPAFCIETFGSLTHFYAHWSCVRQI